MVRPRTFFDFALDNAPIGRVIFELYNDTAPKTSENFRALCTGEKGISPLSDRPLYYKNSIIHRSIKDFMIQGGDFTKRNGMGGESIYGGPFPDEDLSIPVDSEGLLCMANKGPNTNGSQFFITLRECPHLNGKHVVFGRVIRGYDVIQKIAQVPVDEKDRPSTPIVVSNCGELVLKSKPKEEKPEGMFILSSHHTFHLILTYYVIFKVKSREKEAASSDESDRGTRKKRRHRHRSRSRSIASDNAESDDDDRRERRKHRKKSKSKHKKRDRSQSQDDHSDDASKKRKDEPEEETEEQYDARLEREEKERIEAERRRELERMKRRLEDEAARASSNGVRFKGRGRMKFIDPELQRRG